EEPGIHNHEPWLWIPDSRCAASGMTESFYDRNTPPTLARGSGLVLVLPPCGAFTPAQADFLFFLSSSTSVNSASTTSSFGAPGCGPASPPGAPGPPGPA